MGNGQGKPVCFSDEGKWGSAEMQRSVASSSINHAQYRDGLLCLCSRGHQLTRGCSSKSKSLPAVTSRREGRLWEGSDRGAERYWIDLRTEVHPQR
jgi:hypothetical protein